MVQRKIEKTAALFIAAFIILTAFVAIPDWSVVSLHSESSILARCCYSMFHASFLHAALNAWCFLSIVFLYEVTWCHIGVAWLISAAAPPFVLSDTPTVGFSAVCFALLGMLLLKVSRPARYLLCLAPYLLMGLFIPHVNGAVHLYAFMSGVLIAIINYPIPCRRK